jgi:hypothetical protein
VPAPPAGPVFQMMPWNADGAASSNNTSAKTLQRDDFMVILRCAFVWILWQ